MKTIPTLLTTTTDEFLEQIELFQNYFDRIQLDIADGTLVPNKTTQIHDIIALIKEKKITINPSTSLDFHLMVQDYEAELELISNIKELDVNVNVALINAIHQPDITELEDQYDVAIGLDIFPKTTIDTLASLYNLNTVKAIQVMTVEPGFQGSPFLPDMLTKIQQLREKGYKQEILIDGGVNGTTIPTISHQEFTPDILCIGSYLTKAGNALEERIEQLNHL